MKHILGFLVLLCAGWHTNAQVQSSCQPGTALQTLYSRDIAHLALVYMYDTHAPDTTLIDIPQSYIDSVERAMAAVFNLNDQLEADSVMRRHCIHQDCYKEALHLSGARNGVSLQVKVDSFKTWTAGWRNLNAVTGYTALDGLMAHYGFQVTNYYYFGGSVVDNTADIHTSQIINAKAFADSLLKLDGIQEVWFLGTADEADYIRYSYSNGFAYLMFRMGWGDCPMGCTADKRWYYKIDGQCRVTLDSVRQQGNANPYPVPDNCGITAIKDPVSPVSFLIYPNPATDLVFITVKGNEPYRYKLTDTHGRLMLQGTVKGSTSLHLTGFAQGLYWIQVSDKKGNRANEKLVLKRE